MSNKIQRILKQLKHLGRSPYFAFFLVSILLNYLPDLGPHYLSMFAGDGLKVIGPLTQFAEPCFEAPQDEWHCKVQYRIPHRLFNKQQAIGLGVIIFSTEAVCANDPNKHFTISERENDGRTSPYLRSYQSLNLEQLNCNSDLLLKNWSKAEFNRYGYSQGPVTVGTSKWVTAVRKIVELSIAGLTAGLFFTFLIFYFILRTLRRITKISLATPPFDDFSVYWIGFIVLSSGYIFELLLPIDMPGTVVTKLTNFFGLMAVFGPTTSLIASNGNALPPLGGLARAAIRVHNYPWPLIAVSMAIIFPPYTRVGYPYAILAISSLCLIASIRAKHLATLFFAFFGISDALKILMVPYLPASRGTITYMLFVFALNMRRQIYALEENARFEAGTTTAIQISHDINSPLGVLKNLLPKLNGSADLKDIASEAIATISNISNQFLKQARSNTTSDSSVVRVDLVPLIKSIAKLKQAEYSEAAIPEIVLNLHPGESLAFLDPYDFAVLMSNLLNNSIAAATNSDAKITITLRAINRDIEITIHDNGLGISKAYTRHIGTKGFSIGLDGKGNSTGYGLYGARKTVAKWGGKLSISSTSGLFTEVKITFPSAQ